MSKLQHPRRWGAGLLAFALLLGGAAASAGDDKPCRSPLETREALKQLKGRYTLEQGGVLSLEPQGCQLRASIGDAPEVRLVEQAQGLWRSEDGRVELHYRADRYGFVSNVALRAPSQDLRLSQR